MKIRRKLCSRVVALFLGMICLLAASQASAFAIRWTTSGAGAPVSPGETVVVELFLDADPGLQLLSIGILWDAAVVAFDPVASASPSYILYTASPGPGEAGIVSRLRDPWVEWPVPPPGLGQVNVDYTTPPLAFLPAAASGENISLGTFVFDVNAAGLANLMVTIEGAGNLIRANDVEVDPLTVPITLVPEPGTATLLALGLALASIRRRASRRR